MIGIARAGKTYGPYSDDRRIRQRPELQTWGVRARREDRDP